MQSDVLSRLDTREVIPLRRRDCFPLACIPVNLMPAVVVEEVECILETPKLAAVPVRMLKTPVASLAAGWIEVTAALDFLFQGF